jgi:uncharacterized protein YcbK (DUF882 family)
MHDPFDPSRPPPSPLRRRLLIAAGAASLAPTTALPTPIPVPDPGDADAEDALGKNARWLSFLHTHTGERLSIVYAYGDRHVPDALASLDWLLRDFRNDSTHRIDPALFDQLHTLHRATASRAPFEIISGYRSPQTNAMLHQKSDGVATRSLHLVGQAIDVRLADVPLADLRDAALSLRAGGVGFYPGSNFVHVDTGRVRRW